MKAVRNTKDSIRGKGYGGKQGKKIRDGDRTMGSGRKTGDGRTNGEKTIIGRKGKVSLGTDDWTF